MSAARPRAGSVLQHPAEATEGTFFSRSVTSVSPSRAFQCTPVPDTYLIRRSRAVARRNKSRVLIRRSALVEIWHSADRSQSPATEAALERSPEGSVKSAFSAYVIEMGSRFVVALLAVMTSCASAMSSIGGVISGGDTFFPDWGVGGGRTSQPTCVDIPRNLSLCHGIRYSKMRLPNLLDHDSMAEVIQQAASWVPLLNVRCHPDTQLFLCSLFSPVCLDRPIYPCRGLCERVRQGCEGRMKTYGYPWPDMLRCDKFPMDNDMCIGPVSSGSSSDESDCQACEEADTYENIMDHYCRSDFVARTKLRRVRRNKVSAKKAKMLKMSTSLREEWRRSKRPNLVMELGDDCCTDHFNTVALSRSAAGGANGGDRFLVMGVQRNGQLVPTLVLPWTKRSKAIRSAVKAFKQINCSDPKAVFTADHTAVLVEDRPRRGKNLREKSSIEPASSPPVSANTRRNRNQNAGGQRNRSRDGHHPARHHQKPADE